MASDDSAQPNGKNSSGVLRFYLSDLPRVGEADGIGGSPGGHRQGAGGEEWRKPTKYQQPQSALQQRWRLPTWNYFMHAMLRWPDNVQIEC
jgi:hypothetical protein